MPLFDINPTPIVYLTTINNKKVYLKQDYLNHPTVSGNKLRKLKYNLIEAKYNNSTLLSFGGAYSNHIAALASAGKIMGIKTVGVIRGQELYDNCKWGKTLTDAHKNNMHLYFVTRKAYRKKNIPYSNDIKNIIDKYSNVVVIPEGGSNNLSIKGSSEVIKECTQQLKFSSIYLACGTGGTMAGFIDGVAKYMHPRCNVVGISVLKGNDSLESSVKTLTKNYKIIDWSICQEYHFGGYAKKSNRLDNFIKYFEIAYKIPIENIYTGKLCYAVFDKAEKSLSKKSESWLIYHSGGLQGRKIF